MAIQVEVLGAPGRDNALLLRINTGQAIHRLLFDCGEGCVSSLSFAEIQVIDHLFFSHFHMDHVGGFDSFFRATFNRNSKPNVVWGPVGSSAILQHRFQGFLWNLHEEQSASWIVREIHSNELRSFRFELSEAFQVQHLQASDPIDSCILQTADFTVHALEMQHHGPSMAYIVREKSGKNVDTAALGKLGLRPGPWIKQLKEPLPGQTTVSIGDRVEPLAKLQACLLVETPGDCVAYLTDFLLDEIAVERLLPELADSTIVCESQYSETDAALAAEHCHMTNVAAARLARRSGARQLVLFHLSDRYGKEEWPGLLAQARSVFDNTSYPSGWTR